MPSLHSAGLRFLFYPTHGSAADAATPWARLCRLAVRRGSQFPLAHARKPKLEVGSSFPILKRLLESLKMPRIYKLLIL